ncbi:MAG: class I SAM-dependent methyltransferase [Vulcanimicrobiota bacterium]
MIGPPTFFELARQALSSTQRGYDLLAPKFEQTPYATPVPWVRAAIERIEQRYPLEGRDGHGLDLACGTGRGARVLRRYCGSVEGVDFSEGMLEQARRLSAGYSGLHFRQAELHKLELPRRRFDRVVCFGAWGHILPSFRARLLEQVVESLAPGGVFFTLTANEARIFEKRFWYYLAFDLAICIRNLLWFDEFHMYYRLNSTRRLMESLATVLGARADCVLSSEPLPGFEKIPLALVAVYRQPAMETEETPQPPSPSTTV